jgi:sugar phosphate isomerase/epimerase
MHDILNDGSNAPPRLKVYLNLGTLVDLREDSIWPRLTGADAMIALKAAGFDGVQGGDPKQARQAGLGYVHGCRVDAPGEAEELARRLKNLGYEAAILHVGSGFEDDAEMDVLAGDILEASARVDFPLFIETHRATITQDAWRTIQLTKRFPAVRFNGDFSHYYTGQELPYGNLEAKLRAMQPIFDRVRFMHGRIGNPSCMQVDIGDGRIPVPQGFGVHDFVSHHREIWTRAMVGFLRAARNGSYLVFAPEILSSSIYYGRKFQMPDGTLREESDRYAQALVYARIARECFEEARRRL